MELSLDSEIALDTAAVGDPIRAVLVRPLKDGEQILAPEPPEETCYRRPPETPRPAFP